MKVIESLTAKLNNVVETNQEKQIFNPTPDSKDQQSDNPPDLPSVETHTSSLIYARSINLHKNFHSVPNTNSEDNDTVFSSTSKPESEKVTTHLSNGEKACTEKANTSASTRTNAEGDKTERLIQYESGVYVTLAHATGGSNELRRVRFSLKRFTEQQEEKWWSENGA